MHTGFWQQRWIEQQTGFHLDYVNPNLEKHWQMVSSDLQGVVLVPLCGKSIDMLWLAQQGYSVLGIECSDLATRSFFEENKLLYQSEGHGYFTKYSSGQVSILHGDFFQLQKESLNKVSIVYDRAALVALPEDIRKGYADKLSDMLPAGSRMLLVCLEYEQQLLTGPPFSVSNDEVIRLYQSSFKITKLSSQNIINSEQRFRQKGLDALVESVYLLEHI